MKKISLSIILGILLGSLMTYLILNAQPEEVDRATEQWDVVKIQEKQIRDLEKELETQNTNLKQKDLELLKLTSKKELLTFKNDELGFSFFYPAWFGEVSLDIRNGETGKLFYGSFENVSLEFGGTTKDFSEGREGWPTDYNGEAIEKMTFYDDAGLKEFPMKEKQIKTLSVQGGEAIILRGKGDAVPGNWFFEGTFGALIRLNNKQFQGLAFHSGETNYHQNDENDLSIDEFESVLKTLVIK